MSKNEKEETYSAEGVNTVKKILEHGITNNNPFYYKIQVDGLNIVEKTVDMTKFDSFQPFLAEAKEITILIYNSPTTPNHIIKRVFRMQDKTILSQPPQGLGGIEVMNGLLQNAKKEWDNELLKKENVELKEKIKEGETYIGKLEDEVERQKRENMEVLKKKGIKDKDFGMMFSGLAEGLIRRNTHLLAKIPGAEGLAGLIEQDNQEGEHRPADVPPEGEASFSKKSSENPALNEEQERYYAYFKHLEDSFNETEIKEVMEIIDCLIEKPENIQVMAELLNINLKQKTN
jgi:hypothetical protein